jgi:hypothetical protein
MHTAVYLLLLLERIVVGGGAFKIIVPESIKNILNLNFFI